MDQPDPGTGLLGTPCSDQQSCLPETLCMGTALSATLLCDSTVLRSRNQTNVTVLRRGGILLHGSSELAGQHETDS